MSDVQWLFAVLAGLYIWECACWVRRGTVAFTTWLGRHWQWRHPGTLVGNQGGGFIFAVPFPPLGTFFTASQFPLSLSAEGLFAYVATTVNPGWRLAQSGRFIRFDDVREVSVDGRKVLVNGEKLLTAAFPVGAVRVAFVLRQLAKLKPAEREQAIREHIRDSLDVKAIELRREEFQKRVRWLRVLGNSLLVYVFLLAPVLIWELGFQLTWLGLLIGLLAQTGAATVIFRRAHQAFYPKAGDERFTHTLLTLLTPVSTMRAHDVLSRPLLEAFHPLAVAKVLLNESRFRVFARNVLVDVRYPLRPVCPSADPAAVATELFARTECGLAVEEFLKANGVVPEELLRAPLKTEAECRAYCPRCGAQFMTAEGVCADCGGMPLVKF